MLLSSAELSPEWGLLSPERSTDEDRSLLLLLAFELSRCAVLRPDCKAFVMVVLAPVCSADCVDAPLCSFWECRDGCCWLDVVWLLGGKRAQVAMSGSHVVSLLRR